MTQKNEVRCDSLDICVNLIFLHVLKEITAWGRMGEIQGFAFDVRLRERRERTEKV